MSFTRHIACMIAAGCIAGGCDRAPTATVTDSAMHHGSAAFAGVPGDRKAEVNQWLANLRAELAPLHRFEAAAGAGWDAQFPPGCFELAGTGAMGFHYADMARLDGTVDELRPELLVYEPQKNGKLQFVAVEYVVPFAAWTDPNPPSIHGIQFHENFAFGVWILHAWIWQENPSGIFMDWNPRVTCDYAD